MGYLKRLCIIQAAPACLRMFARLRTSDEECVSVHCWHRVSLSPVVVPDGPAWVKATPHHDPPDTGGWGPTGLDTWASMLYSAAAAAVRRATVARNPIALSSMSTRAAHIRAARWWKNTVWRLRCYGNAARRHTLTEPIAGAADSDLGWAFTPADSPPSEASACVHAQASLPAKLLYNYIRVEGGGEQVEG
jgi:hypothetical protein